MDVGGGRPLGSTADRAGLAFSGREPKPRGSTMRFLPCLFVLAVAACPVGAQKVVNMTELGRCEIGPPGSGACRESSGVNDVWGYEQGGVEYALMGTREGTAIYDVSTDPSSPAEVAFVPGPTSIWRDIKTKGSFALICHDVVDSGESPVGLQIVDLSDLPGSVSLTTYDTTFDRAHNLFVDGDTLYVCRDAGGSPTFNSLGLEILDISDPTDPVLLSRYDSREVHDVYVRDDILYAACEHDGLFFLDVSDKTNPVEIGSKTYSGQLTHNVWLTNDGKYALTTDEILGGHLRIWDVTDLSDVVQVAEYEAKPDVGIVIHNVFVRGNHAFISYYTEGVVVLDITDPTQPCEIGYYDTYPLVLPTPPTNNDVFHGVWGVYPYTTSGRIYASDIEQGLFVLDFVPPERDPVDVILTMDVSGSMSSPATSGGEAKIQVLRDAVEIFLNTWLAFTVPQDRMGFVTFESSVASFPAGSPPVLVPFCTNFQELVSEAQGLTAGGSTAMGGGLLTTFRGFDSASTARKAAILFTDGMQNISPMVVEVPPGHEIVDQPVGGDVKGVSGVAGQAGSKIGDFGVDLHSIAVGVLPPYENLLADIAAETDDGLFHAADAPDATLRQFFESDLVNALKGTTVQLIDHRTGTLTVGETAEEVFHLNRSIRQATFVVSWRGVRQPNAIRAEIVSPLGFPLGLGGIVRHGEIYSIVSIPFPYRLRDEVVRPEGEWRVRLGAVAEDGLPYHVSVLVDENLLKLDFGPDRFLFGAGELVPLSVSVRYGEAPATDVKSVTARVSGPTRSLADAFAENPTDPVALAEETFGLAPDHFPSLASKRLFELRRDGATPTPSEVQTGELALFDDGQPEHGDAKVGDGIYSAVFENTDVQGRYRLHFTVEGASPDTGSYSRTHASSIRVAVLAVDPDRSETSVELVREDDEGGRGYRARVVPRDSLGNLLGPGHVGRIVFGSRGGVAGAVEDRLDGSYETDIRVPASSEDPTWSVDVLGTRIAEGSLEAGATRIPFILIALGVLAIVAILLVLLRLR
jgi:choice-of-anchor B domain-containing protein